MPEEKKGGFWSRLGRGLVRALPVIEKGAARVAAAYGNPEALQRIEMLNERDYRRDQQAKALERQASLDAMAAEEHGLRMEGLRQQQSAFETPEQKDARALASARKLNEMEQEFKPPFAATTERTEEPLYRYDATGGVVPLTTNIQRPSLGPAPIMGPLIKPPSVIKARLYKPRPAKADTSITPYEDLRSGVPERVAAAEKWLQAQKDAAKDKSADVLSRQVELEEIRQRNRERMEELRSQNRLTTRQADDIAKINRAISVFDELERQAAIPENQQLFQAWLKSPGTKLANWLMERSGTLTQNQKDFVRFLNTTYAQTRKEIAGTAVTVYEGKLAEQAFPNLDLPSYGDFQAAVKASRFAQEKLKEHKLSGAEALRAPAQPFSPQPSGSMKWNPVTGRYEP